MSSLRAFVVITLCLIQASICNEALAKNLDSSPSVQDFLNHRAPSSMQSPSVWRLGILHHRLRLDASYIDDIASFAPNLLIQRRLREFLSEIELDPTRLLARQRLITQMAHNDKIFAGLAAFFEPMHENFMLRADDVVDSINHPLVKTFSHLGHMLILPGAILANIALGMATSDLKVPTDWQVAIRALHGLSIVVPGAVDMAARPPFLNDIKFHKSHAQFANDLRRHSPLGYAELARQFRDACTTIAPCLDRFLALTENVPPQHRLRRLGAQLLSLNSWISFAAKRYLLTHPEEMILSASITREVGVYYTIAKWWRNHARSEQLKHPSVSFHSDFPTHFSYASDFTPSQEVDGPRTYIKHLKFDALNPRINLFASDNGVAQAGSAIDLALRLVIAAQQGLPLPITEGVISPTIPAVLDIPLVLPSAPDHNNEVTYLRYYSDLINSTIPQLQSARPAPHDVLVASNAHLGHTVDPDFQRAAHRFLIARLRQLGVYHIAGTRDPSLVASVVNENSQGRGAPFLAEAHALGAFEKGWLWSPASSDWMTRETSPGEFFERAMTQAGFNADEASLGYYIRTTQGRPDQCKGVWKGE